MTAAEIRAVYAERIHPPVTAQAVYAVLEEAGANWEHWGHYLLVYGPEGEAVEVICMQPPEEK